MSGGQAHPISAVECAALLPELARDANKYSRGMLAVVGGSASYPAAPVMAAKAGMRAGAGYVRLIAPERAAVAAQAHLLSIPVNPCTQAADGGFSPEAAGQAVEAAAKARALAIGCGLGRGPGAVAFYERLLQQLAQGGDARPVLFDADALSILAEHPGLFSLRSGCDDVLTPHEGEAARLLGRKVVEREDDARALARRFRCTVVLKGPRTLIAGPDGRLSRCDEGGPELAKAGTGDVLSGIVAALMAQGLSAYDAACAGVFVHGRAGRMAAERMGARSVMAEDIIEAIGKAFESVEGSRFS